MAGYVVELAPRGNEDLQTLSPDVALQIARKMRLLGDDPSPRGDTIKRLQGFKAPTFRLRIGDYRAIFRIGGNVVRVLCVVHRSQLDRALRELL